MGGFRCVCGGGGPVGGLMGDTTDLWGLYRIHTVQFWYFSVFSYIISLVLIIYIILLLVTELCSSFSLHFVSFFLFSHPIMRGGLLHQL
jgi:hypothetical protein